MLSDHRFLERRQEKARRRRERERESGRAFVISRGIGSMAVETVSLTRGKNPSE